MGLNTNLDTVTFIYGSIGSGKTSGSVANLKKLCLEHYKRVRLSNNKIQNYILSGYTGLNYQMNLVYSNFDFRLKHKTNFWGKKKEFRPNVFNWSEFGLKVKEDIKDDAERLEENTKIMKSLFPPYSVFIVDEGQNEIDSRTWQQLEEATRVIMSIPRHFHYRILFITQYLENIDIRVRKYGTKYIYINDLWHNFIFNNRTLSEKELELPLIFHSKWVCIVNHKLEDALKLEKVDVKTAYKTFEYLKKRKTIHFWGNIFKRYETRAKEFMFLNAPEGAKKLEFVKTINYADLDKLSTTNRNRIKNKILNPVNKPKAKDKSD
jgi:hypothetical protein